MALTAVIIVIIIIFVLFTYFVCCNGKDDEEKRQNEGNRTAAVITTTSYPNTAGNVGAINPPYPTQARHPVPHVGSAGPPQPGFAGGYPPAPSMPMPYQTQPYPHPAPYPPISSPYPPANTAPYPTGGVSHQSVRADVYNTSAVNTTSVPSAPTKIDDCSQPPSYFEAVGHQVPTYSDKQLPYNPHY